MAEPTAAAATSYPATYYSATAHVTPPVTPLQGEQTTEVAVVGGGFTGVATALALAERGRTVRLLEANRIGWGASGRNGGQFTDSVSGEDTIRRQLGAEAEELIWHLRWHGHSLIEDRVQRYGIDCDLKHGHLRVAKKARQVPALRHEYDELVARGHGDAVRFVEGDQLRTVIGSDAYVAGLINRRNGHLHPLNLCLGEAAAARDLGVTIHEGSPVTGISHGNRPTVTTSQGRIHADQVVLAGNAYHGLEPQQLRGRLFPATSHIVVTEPLSRVQVEALNPQDLAVYDSNHVIDYYRLTPDRRLLFGAGCRYSGHDPGDIDAALRPALSAVFPQLADVRIDYRWGGRIGIVLNRVPQVGYLSRNVVYAQGYSGHGICLSHVLGDALAATLSDGSSRDFAQLARIRHWRLPLGPRAGSALVALGMLYYRLLDRF